MIVERILLVTGLSQGFLPAVRDCILYSQAAGLGGLAMLKRDFDTLKGANPSAMQVSSEAGSSVLDGAHQHAWIVAPGLLDLALAEARSGRSGEYSVRNVTESAELLLLQGYAGRYGAQVEVLTGDGRGKVRVIADGLIDADEALTRSLVEGLPVPKALWQELYAKSHEALTPDSIVSRRHAGPVMVDEQGIVHGRDDDDTDFALLGVSKSNSTSENA